jgi:hypothetical protein
LSSLVVDQLQHVGCIATSRVIIEKPFGRDLASARLLNRTLCACFDERRIFRMTPISANDRCTTCCSSSRRNAARYRFQRTVHARAPTHEDGPGAQTHDENCSSGRFAGETQLV